MSDRTIAKIASFRDLKVGWNYGDGVPPTAAKVQEACRIVQMFEGLGYLETNAFPGTDGEILVRAYHLNRAIGFTLEIDDSISMSILINGDPQDCPDMVDLEGARYHALRVFNEAIIDAWSSSFCALQIPGTSIIKQVISPRLHSRNTALTNVPQSWTETVLPVGVYLRANISVNSMPV